MCLFCVFSYSRVLLHATWHYQIDKTKIRILSDISTLSRAFFSKAAFLFHFIAKRRYFVGADTSNYTKGKRTTSAFNRRPRTSTAICVPALAKAGLT